MSQPSSENERLAKILEVIFRFASGDLKARGTLLDDESAMDGVMAGVNILGEELEAKAEEIERANNRLREAFDYAQTLIRSSPDGVLAINRAFQITEWNRRMELIAGTAKERAVGRILDDIPFIQETGEAARIREGVQSNHIQSREFAYRLPEMNEERFFESSVAPLTENGGSAEGAVIRITDITERKRAEERLRLASMYARSLIEAGLDPLVTISTEGWVTDVNEATVQATGVPRDQLIGSDFSAYFTDPDSAHAAYQAASAKGLVKNWPLTMRHVSGKLTEVLYNASVYRSEKGEIAGIMAVARDITERKRAERAEELARRDGLTNLNNHWTFNRLLDEETARTRRFKRPVSLLMLDIDHFKRVNDAYGHQAGDAILKDLSDLLLKQSRAIDHVCRYGGEEFAIILPETNATVAMQIAERLRAEVERQPFDIGGTTIGITVSIGVATYPQQADSQEGLVKAADIALYAAKHAGRNRVCRFGRQLASHSSAA